MALTGAQVRGKIKNIAKSNRADARILMRIYMMERFLERVANSPYSENFIIKGGILVTSMIGISMRSTMDIDTSIRNLNLSEEDERVARYLKGETISLLPEEGPIKGWCLVAYRGFPLGWAKGNNMTLKNKYYPGWRLQ